MKGSRLFVTSVRWAQTVTATAVAHTSFENLILLVSENVSFFDMDNTLTPLNLGVIGGGVMKLPFFFDVLKVCCYKCLILNMIFTHSYAARKSPQFLCRMYAVSWKLAKRHHFEVEHFDQVCSVKCIDYAQAIAFWTLWRYNSINIIIIRVSVPGFAAIIRRVISVQEQTVNTQNSFSKLMLRLLVSWIILCLDESSVSE